MIYLSSALVIYCYNFWQATSSLPLVIERYFPTLSRLPAATSDPLLWLVLVKWKGWETKKEPQPSWCWASGSCLGSGNSCTACAILSHSSVAWLCFSEPIINLWEISTKARSQSPQGWTARKEIYCFSHLLFIIFFLNLDLHPSVFLQVSCSCFSHCLPWHHLPSAYHLPCTNNQAFSISPPCKSPQPHSIPICGGKAVFAECNITQDISRAFGALRDHLVASLRTFEASDACRAKTKENVKTEPGKNRKI